MSTDQKEESREQQPESGQPCDAAIRGIVVADCDLLMGHEGAHTCRHEAGGVTSWWTP